MRILLMPILLTFPSLSDTYIHNSVITNSTIGSNIPIEQSSGILSTKSITPRGEFHKIDIRVPANVRVEQSSKRAIRLKMEKKFIDNVEFRVSNGTLTVTTIGSINSRSKIEIIIPMDSIDALRVSTTAKVILNRVSSNYFDLSAFGTSKVIFRSGDIGTLSLHSGGTSRVDLSRVHIKNAKIVSKGTSRTKIDVSDNLTVKLSGISKVRYSGNPQIRKSISGLGKLIKTR
jgi:hypothetical protein